MQEILATDAKKRRFGGWKVAVPLAAASALILAGCASTGGSSTGDSSTAATDGPTVAIIGGAASDGFFNAVKNGAEAAALGLKAAGGELTYLALKNYENLGPDVAELIRTAVGQGVDVIAVPDWVADAEDPEIQAAIKAGIPVFIYNSGGEVAMTATGSQMYIGTDETKAGIAAGEEFSAQGAKNIICVNTAPGASNTEARCAGVAEGAAANGGVSNQLPLPASALGDQAAISQAIKGALVADPTIDGVITIGASDSDAAASGIEQASKTDSVKLGTFDLSENVLNRIADGTQLFAVDQQPYLQGYQAVSFAWQYVQYGITSPNKVFLTGPSLVTADNVATVQAGVKLGAR